MYVYSAGKFASQWNDTTDYNSTANNFVDQSLNGGATNTMGNFLAGTLSMASMRSTGGAGEAYVDLTPQVGPFHQDTTRGTYAIDGTTVAEANEWYSQPPLDHRWQPVGLDRHRPGRPLRLQRRRHRAARLQRRQDDHRLRQPDQRHQECAVQR